jgi:hypothetical protein
MMLRSNWNRNDHQHLFLTHRYNIGFYRKVKMTEAELKAREFAIASKKEKEAKEQQKLEGKDGNSTIKKPEQNKPAGRPENAKIMGAEHKKDSITVAAIDTTRIKVDSQAAIDSLNRAQAIQDSIDATMKKEYVPVTSIFHTFEWNNDAHIYQAYDSPSQVENYYKNTYYERGPDFGNDSIYDQVRATQIKNTVGLALLEGFNKYVKAGLKGFVTFDHINYRMPDVLDNVGYLTDW